MKVNKLDLERLFLAMKENDISIDGIISLIKSSKGGVESGKIFSEEIKLIIDHSKTIKQLVDDANYDQVDDGIFSKKFLIYPGSVDEKVEVYGKLFNFDKSINYKNFVSEMRAAGCRPATSIELLILGILYPELQKKFPIIALGSSWRYSTLRRYVLILDAYGKKHKRRLGFTWIGKKWSPDCCFLGIYI